MSHATISQTIHEKHGQVTPLQKYSKNFFVKEGMVPYFDSGTTSKEAIKVINQQPNYS